LVISPSSCLAGDYGGRVVTPCGRPSVHGNPLRGLFPYSGRGVENSLTIFGIRRCLGKCVGIIGINMLGPKFACNEQSVLDLRMKLFDTSVNYCLDTAQIERFRSFPAESQREYVRNLCVAQSKTLCTELVSIVRQQFQNDVFGASYRDPMLYEHLGLPIDKSLVDK
jgi:hypothetical protein